MVPHFSQTWEGTRSSAGAVPLFRNGLPAHLRAPSGSSIEGVAQAGKSYVTGGQASKATAIVKIATTATVALQGCNGDPSVAGDWATLETALTATGVISTSKPAAFYRVQVTAHTAGAVDAELQLSE